MRGFDHARILSPSFHGLRKERLAQWPAFCVPKIPGVLPEKLGGGVRHASWNPYPISDQNLWFSLPYFRPDQKFDILFQTWSPGARRWPEYVTSCHGTYTVVGVNIKREMVLLETMSSPPFFLRDKRERTWKPPHARKGRHACRLFSRGVIFTRACVSLALL